jgi:hypothetical protein
MGLKKRRSDLENTPRGFVDDGSDAELVLRVVCVTGRVTIRSERDEQDASGHNPAIEGYLA